MIQNNHEMDKGHKGNETELGRMERIFQAVKREGRDDVELYELEKIIKVCDAERDSQKLISKTYSIRAPIGKIFRSCEFSMTFSLA